MASGLESTIGQYADRGPLVASFLANLLATFGDKGQLVVITLAARYDAKRVFVGAMAAFGLWSALEVTFASSVIALLPPGAMAVVTGGLFLAFGVLTLRNAIARVDTDRFPGWIGARTQSTASRESEPGPDPELLQDGGSSVPAVAARVSTQYGAVVTSFVFIAFAEFGDKTQALTIALAGTFPDAPLSVFVGVVAALGLRTGVDAIIGEHIERYIPTRSVEVAAGIVFLTFGLAVFDVLSETMLLGVVVLVVLGLVACVLSRR